MFTPVVSLGGYAGWKLFERTSARQLAAFAKAPLLQRDVKRFLDHAGDIRSADALLGNPRLLTVALGAFGLESERSKRAIIRRVLEESTSDPKSFANRLNDPRWRAFAKAFSFADGAQGLSSPARRADIATRFIERSFESAVGEADADIRLALNFRREIGVIAQGDSVDRAGWFQILGQQPLRRVIEAAFGLPESFASLEVDRQREILETKAEAVFKTRSPALFRDKENVERVLQRFFLSRASAASPGSGSGATALSLLTARGGASSAGLINANAIG